MKSYKWKVVFWVISILGLFVMLFISKDYGINGDGYLHKLYADNLASWYTSFGKSGAVWNKILNREIYKYGGFFDLIAGLLVKVFGQYDAFVVRHMFNAFLGWGIMVLVGFTARMIGGHWKYTFLGLLFAFFSPRLLGHSMFNPKDIPFALGNMLFIYGVISLLKNYSSFKWKQGILIVLGIGLAVSMRASGVLLMLYLPFFYVLKYVYNTKKDSLKWSLLKPFLKRSLQYILPLMILGYLLGILFYPYLLVSPIDHLFEMLTEESSYQLNIRSIFDGKTIYSAHLPWYYIPKYLLITTPLVVLCGVLWIPFILHKQNKSKDIYALFVVIFMFIFPIAYVIYKKSVLYDALRHFVFVVPILALLGAVGWGFLLDMLSSNKYLKGGAYVILAILLYFPASWTISSHPNQYVYFNKAFGGIDKAFGNYETDYWHNSADQALQWLVDNKGILDTKDTLIIASDCNQSLMYRSTFFPSNVKYKYVRYRERNSKDWDYGIFYSRFADIKQLQHNAWPPVEVIKNITAGNTKTSLTTILERNPEKYDFKGEQALKEKKHDLAIKLFQEYEKHVGANEYVYASLADCYLQKGEYALAIKNAKKALQVHPSNIRALTFLGGAYFNTARYKQAVLVYQRILKGNPNYVLGYYYLGLSKLYLKEYRSAVKYLNIVAQNNAQLAPRAYKIIGDIFLQSGDKRNAQIYYQKSKNIGS